MSWSDMISNWYVHGIKKGLQSSPECLEYTELILPENCAHIFYPESNKSCDFMDFVEQMVIHIDEYTVPQYGDGPNDESEHYTLEFICNQIRKYLARFTSGVRGEQEQLRDYLKIAHYAQMAWKLYRRALTTIQKEE